MSDARARRRKAALALAAVLVLLGTGGLALWLRTRAGDAIPSEDHGGGGGGASAPAALPAGAGGGLAASPRVSGPVATDVLAPPIAVRSLTASIDRIHAAEHRLEIPTRVEMLDVRTGAGVFGARWRSRRIFGRDEDWRPSGTVGPCCRTRRPEVRLPAGWAMFDEWWPGSTIPDGFVEARARMLAFPEANVRVTLAGSEGPSDGTRLEILYAFVDGEPAEAVRDDVGADGVHRVNGIPFLPNASLVLVLDRVKVRAPDEVDEWRPGDSQEAEITILPDQVRLVRATLPATESEAIHLHVDLPTLALEARPHGSSKPPPDVRFITETEAVTVSGGDPWALLEVAVRDADGAPAPFSRLELEATGSVAYADLDDEGHLRLDPYTDRLGRRTFHRVLPGPVWIVARHRGRSVESRFEVRGGDHRVLVLTLPE